mmetsp:Transcript_46241/g.115962  ORF Transcript_46241/g.115962 Transcript_46241/m.115962 type:complete len:207 (+) Transcript_46241:109-729(+)
MSLVTETRTASRSIMLASSTVRVYLIFCSGFITCPSCDSSDVYASSSESLMLSIMLCDTSSIARVQHCTCRSLKAPICDGSEQSHSQLTLASFVIWFWNANTVASRWLGAHGSDLSTCMMTDRKSACCPRGCACRGDISTPSSRSCSSSSTSISAYGTVVIVPTPGALSTCRGSSSRPCISMGSAWSDASASGLLASKSILLMVRQ